MYLLIIQCNYRWVGPIFNICILCKLWITLFLSESSLAYLAITVAWELQLRRIRRTACRREVTAFPGKQKVFPEVGPCLREKPELDAGFWSFFFFSLICSARKDFWILKCTKGTKSKKLFRTWGVYWYLYQGRKKSYVSSNLILHTL